MRSVTVVGAGFSGLTLAYYLNKLGFMVTVVEKQKRVGGMIDSQSTPWGVIESAANALLADEDVEALFAELGLEFAERRRERTMRYVFFRKPSRWPLGLGTTLRLGRMLYFAVRGAEKVLPRAGETVRDWGRRVVDAEFEERLLEPGLNGVFAGDDKRLSAPLTLGALFLNRGKRGKLSGSVAPTHGMRELLAKLEAQLRNEGVRFKLGESYDFNSGWDGPLVVCTSAWSAAEMLNGYAPDAAAILKQVESVPLISATLFFKPDANDPRGFGCLFPRTQKFNSLGVLFNHDIFEREVAAETVRSETWILGGARHLEVMAWNDEQVLEAIRSDRARLGSNDAGPVHFQIQRWPRAIPHYTVEWERNLKKLVVKPPLFLHGNYLGALGLTRILRRSRELAREIREMYADA